MRLPVVVDEEYKYLASVSELTNLGEDGDHTNNSSDFLINVIQFDIDDFVISLSFCKKSGESEEKAKSIILPLPLELSPRWWMAPS